MAALSGRERASPQPMAERSRLVRHCPSRA